MSRKFLLPAALMLFLPVTCFASHYKITLDYQPPAPAITAADGPPVTVVVADQRTFVVNHDKVPAHLGHYRSVAGIPWDVDNHDEVALADQFKGDLDKDLQNLGFRPGAAAAGTTVTVTVHTFDFNTYANGRLTFDVEAVATAPDGHNLASVRITDNRIIQANAFAPPIGAMEKEVPVIYAEIIRKLVRENPDMLRALRGQGAPASP